MSVLDTANTIIYGDREQTYGHPARNLLIVADFWKVWLSAKHGVEVDLTAEDVCHMMSLLKIARLSNTPGHTDSLVDLCGYTALVERINDRQQEAQGAGPSPARH
jgi:hypothetical protein